jgi:chromate transporter
MWRRDGVGILDQALLCHVGYHREVNRNTWSAVTAASVAGPPKTLLGPKPLTLFLAFFRLGLTAFGGPAMVAYIGKLAVKERGWLSDESFRDGAALCQMIPGATAIQSAAYVGLRAAGGGGAAAAFVGFGLPAFLLMLLLSVLYQHGHDAAPVIAAFAGLQVIVVAIVANAALNFARGSLRSWQDGLLTAGAALALVFGFSPLLVIAAAGALGLLIYRGAASQVVTSHPQDHIERQGGRTAFVVTAAAAVALLALFFATPRLFDLSTLMMRVDLFAFGGGYASVPLMLHEVVSVRGWMDSKTFMDGIALGQVTPGPIVITATFVGYRLAGLLGAAIATISAFTPSFVILAGAVAHFDRLRRSVLFNRALRGVLASFVGLLVAVAIRFGLVAAWSLPAIVIALLAFIALRFRVNILWVVLAGAIVSALVL